MYEDYVLAAAAAVIVAGVIVMVTLLSRYRILAAETLKSNQMAKDLWGAFDARLKKQDERIVELLARVEIHDVKSELGRGPVGTRESLNAVSHGSGRPSTRSSAILSTDIEKKILGELYGSARTSTQIRIAVGKSREHTARLMKSLFDAGYVSRNDQRKPFVYELTEAGRRYLAESRSTGT